PATAGERAGARGHTGSEMRIARGATAVVLAATAVVGAAAGAPGTAVAAPAPAPAVVRWSPALAGGDPVRVEVTRDGARPTLVRQTPDTASPDGPTNTRFPGLLTLPARQMEDRKSTRL